MTKENKSKNTIIEAASRLFQLYGYHGVGLSEIIKESGTAKGSLYYYFPNGKEELAIAAINYTKEMVANKFRTATEGIDDPIKAVQAYFYKLSDEFGKDAIVGVRIGTIAGETSLVYESIRLACKSALEEWQSLYIEKFIAAGCSVKQSKDLALMINAMIEGGIIFSLTEKSGEPLRIIAEQLPILLKMEKDCS